jgi:hypothetical protein
MIDVVRVGFNNYLEGFGKKWRIDFTVRNLINGYLKPGRIARSIPSGEPYIPEPFPPGRFEIYRPLPRQSEWLAPYFVPTNAKRTVRVWELDENGNYKLPTDRQVIDEGYGLHYSPLPYTDGCIRFINRDNLLEFTRLVNAALDKGHRVWLEV